MVLSLGLMLALVVGGGYGVRRYLLDRPLLGKRDTATLRVLSRVSITPKAGVALVEVPGKILVVGLTGSAMTLLGEVPAVALREAPDKAETVPEAPISSFDTALQHQVHNLEPQPMDDDPLLSVSQAIHRKVSSLKQL
jgi:flagellar biogenesis protein FliO